MRILFSRPRSLDLDAEARLPPDFVEIANELQIENDSARRFNGRIAGWVVSFRLLLRIFQALPGADCIVTGRYGEEFSILRGLLGLRRPPLIILGIEWLGRRRGTVGRPIGSLLHRLIARGATRIGVFCKEEAIRYSKWYGIDFNKFIWVQYCTGVDPARFPAKDGGYLFSGGNWNRDWRTFFEAIRDVPIETRVAAAPSTVPRALAIPPNVTLLGRVSKDEFHRQIAGATLVALSLSDNHLRSRCQN